jgi:hypothetical protein
MAKWIGFSFRRCIALAVFVLNGRGHARVIVSADSEHEAVLGTQLTEEPSAPL